VIKFDSIYKSYGHHAVLKGVSGEVDKGQVVALLGPSGSGKSTLLRCLNLLERPDAGHIYVNGINLLSPGCNIRRMRKTIGMVFQHFYLFPNMTVLDNVTYAPQKVLKQSFEEASKNGLRLLERVGLSEKVDAYPSRLSGGQKQRVAIARALAMNPEVMLFDEPTSSLDPEMVKEVLDVIKGLVAAHMTILIVTHEMQFAREGADEIWFLDQGHIIEKTPPKKFFTAPQTERARIFLDKIL
jgi:arginine/lysine/histidine transport system ATP-binding protein